MTINLFDCYNINDGIFNIYIPEPEAFHYDCQFWKKKWFLWSSNSREQWKTIRGRSINLWLFKLIANLKIWTAGINTEPSIDQVEEKRPHLAKEKVKDNARVLQFVVALAKFNEFGYKLLLHLPYSPDLAPGG